MSQICYGINTSRFFPFDSPPTVRRCQSSCFSVKRSPVCYPNCHRVLSVAAGVCSGREVNDRQAASVTTLQKDASNPEPLIWSPVSQHFPTEGGWAGWRDGGEEVHCCRMMTWGLTCRSGGKQEEDGWVVFRSRNACSVAAALTAAGRNSLLVPNAHF